MTIIRFGIGYLIDSCPHGQDKTLASTPNGVWPRQREDARIWDIEVHHDCHE